jgi:hypothetical protein
MGEDISTAAVAEANNHLLMALLIVLVVRKKLSPDELALVVDAARTSLAHSPQTEVISRAREHLEVALAQLSALAPAPPPPATH